MRNPDKHIEEFRWWCNHVLPTAYDNSLSYYEVLCKVTKFLNYVLEKYTDLSEEIVDAVNDWLDEHPEATTTVEDGSITNEKLAPDVIRELRNAPNVYGVKL